MKTKHVVAAEDTMSSDEKTPQTSHVGNPYDDFNAFLPSNLAVKAGETPLAFKADDAVQFARKAAVVGQGSLCRNDLVEAHCWFMFALALLEDIEYKTEQTKLAIIIARMYHESDRLHEAGSVLRTYDRSENNDADLCEILSASQMERVEAWARADTHGDPLRIFNGEVEQAASTLRQHFIQEASAWQASPELEETRARCALSLGRILFQFRSIIPGTNRYGVRGILDDTPHPDALQPQWDKSGNLNFLEQEKSVSLFWRSMTVQQDAPPEKLKDMLKGEVTESSPLCESKLYSKPSVRIPCCKFISVRALLDMEMLLRYEMIPESSFVNRAHFAVSHRWQSTDHPDPAGSTLCRLKTILRNVEGVELDDGVFIDYCCLPQGRHDEKAMARRLIATTSMDQLYKNVHVIFLPSGDYFLRSWCWHEYICWLLSTRPTQALGDHMPAMHSAVNDELALSLFDRPVFLLDRAELSSIESCWFGCTQTSVAADRDLLKAVSSRSIQEPCQINTSLLESLTRIVWKFETVLNVSTEEEESVYSA